MVDKKFDSKVLLMMMAMFVGFLLLSTSLLASPLPKDCRIESQQPFRLRGKVTQVTVKQSYVSFKVRVRSKINLCTGQEVAPAQKYETVSFGGRASFKDRFNEIRNPASLQIEDQIVATGSYGPLVFPADCPAGKNCYSRGIVLYQPGHRLVRR